MANMQGPELVFVPLGGVGEIGMNFALYGYGPADRARVDHRRLRRDLSRRRSCPASTSCCPIPASSRRELANLKGIVITHAHEDHYGALLDLWPRLKAQCWMTPFTAGLLEAKRQSEPGAPQIPVTIYRAGETFTVGPFAIEAIPVAHSIPEPVSLAITTPAGTVIHTGDWKIDPDAGNRPDDRRGSASARSAMPACWR